MAVIPGLSIGAVNPAKQQENFVTQVGGTGSGPKVVAPPRRKAFKLSEETLSFVKIFLFGPIGGGKTDAIGQLVEAGVRVAMVTTDIGDSGHITIMNRLRRAGKLEMMENILIIPLAGYEEVSAFLRDPHKYIPELAEFNAEVLAWDGYSGFQQIDISDYVGGLTALGTRTSEQRETGLQLEVADWGLVRNATIRTGDKFLSIKHPSGRPYHKILTCHEATGYKAKDSSKPSAGQELVVETYKPMISGSGSQLLLGGFDLVLRCGKKERVVEVDGKRIRSTAYSYATSGTENTVAKNRGFDLMPEEPGNFCRIWNRTAGTMGGKILPE